MDSPPPLEYERPAPPMPKPPPSPAAPAAGISGLLVAAMTLLLTLVVRLLVPDTAVGLFMLPMTIAFWPLGLVLSAVGLFRPGGRRWAAGGAALSAATAVLVVRTAAAVLHGR